jgi:hypothetical protein
MTLPQRGHGSYIPVVNMKNQTFLTLLFTAGMLAASAFAGADGSEKIEGAFGIRFGEDIRPYLEGHYAELYREVPGFDFPSNNDFNYMLLKPPVDLQAAFGDAHLRYMGLPNSDGDVVELMVEVNLIQVCQQSDTTLAVLEALRRKYRVVHRAKPNSEPHETYTDGTNEIDVQCDISLLNIRYTSAAFSAYVADRHQARHDKQTQVKKSLEKGL